MLLEPSDVLIQHVTSKIHITVVSNTWNLAVNPAITWGGRDHVWSPSEGLWAGRPRGGLRQGSQEGPRVIAKRIQVPGRDLQHPGCFLKWVTSPFHRWGR